MLRPVIEALWADGIQVLFYAEGQWHHHWDAFLELPRELLITTLRFHQKCFSVQDEQGELLGAFLAEAVSLAVDGDIIGLDSALGGDDYEDMAELEIITDNVTLRLVADSGANIDLAYLAADGRLVLGGPDVNAIARALDS